VRRRDFLQSSLTLLAAGAPAVARAAGDRRRVVWLRREAFNEEIRVPFTLDGKTVYEPGYRAICWLLRDHAVPSSQGYVRFDVVAIEVLWEVQRALGAQGVNAPIVITSGYRCAQTNANTEGAARNSQHLYAKAVDMYVPGVSPRELFDVCWSRGLAGGIGYYDSHVHLDSATRRWWVGTREGPSSVPGREGATFA
jgi:uncharacterized protein YcbK (DUF882 family)